MTDFAEVEQAVKLLKARRRVLFLQRTLFVVLWALLTSVAVVLIAATYRIQSELSQENPR